MITDYRRGDIIQRIIVTNVDYRRLIEIIPIRESGDSDILSMPVKGGWKEIEVQSGDLMPDDFKPLSMPLRWAEQLRDELVKVLGSVEKDATTQELKATKYHLEDMRKLHFKQIERKFAESVLSAADRATLNKD